VCIGDVKGGFNRSITLAILVTMITVVISFLARLAFKRRFWGDTVVFYVVIGSLVAPGLVLGLGTGILADHPGLQAAEVDVTEGVGQDVVRGVERIAAHGWE
jgi:putative spermidine/putrescine transport system permease protein